MATFEATLQVIVYPLVGEQTTPRYLVVPGTVRPPWMDYEARNGAAVSTATLTLDIPATVASNSAVVTPNATDAAQASRLGT